MDENRMIQSRLEPDLSLADLAVPAELAVYSFDSECVEREIREYRLKNAVMETAARIESGDFIEFTAGDSQRRIPATVGLGLLGRETESALLGRGVGDTVTAGEAPYGGRELTVRSIRRRVLPEFSDQAAGELGYDSVEAFRAGRLEELRSQARRARARELAMEECMGRLAQTALYPWGTELEELIRSYGEINDELFRSRNMDPATVDPGELEQMFGVRSTEELAQKAAESAETNLKLAIIGQKAAQEKNVSFGKEDYEQAVRDMAKKYLMEASAVRNATPFLAALVEKYVKLLIAELIARAEAAMREV